MNVCAYQNDIKRSHSAGFRCFCEYALSEWCDWLGEAVRVGCSSYIYGAVPGAS